MEHWVITGTNSPSANVELSYYDPNSGGVTFLPDLRVARFDGTTWQNEGNTATIGTPGSNGSVTSNTVTNYSPFTLASTTTLNPLPVKDINLSYSLTNNFVKLQWKAYTDVDVIHYEIEKNATNNFNRIGTTNAQRIGGIANYIFSDLVSDANVSYRIKAFFNNGTIAFSNTILVPNAVKKGLIRLNNPITTTLHFYTNLPKGNVSIINSIGNIINKSSFVNGNNSLSTYNLPKGYYTIRLSTADGKMYTNSFIKQ